MNGKERFFAAVDHEKVDRVPVCMWHHYFNELSRGAENVLAQKRFALETGVDVIKISVDGYFEYPFTTPIQTSSDWRRIRPLADNSSYFSEQIERALMINDCLGADRATLYVIFVPFSVIRHSTSNELVMAHMREDPQSVCEGLKVVLDDCLRLMRGVMEKGGCDGMLLPLQGAETGRFTPEEYRKWVRPGDEAVYDQAASFSRYNIAHLCGWTAIPNQLECWEGLNEGVRMINWATAIEGFGLGEGLKRFAPRAVMGGFDNRRGCFITTADEARIKARTARILDEAGTSGVMLGADCSLPADIAHERIRWVVEACADYGAK